MWGIPVNAQKECGTHRRSQSSSCSRTCVYITCDIKVPHQFCVLCLRESVDHFHVFAWLTLATISSLISNLNHFLNTFEGYPERIASEISRYSKTLALDKGHASPSLLPCLTSVWKHFGFLYSGDRSFGVIQEMETMLNILQSLEKVLQQKLYPAPNFNSV